MWLTIYQTQFYNAKYVLKMLKSKSPKSQRIKRFIRELGSKNWHLKQLFFIMVNGESRGILAKKLIDH